MHAEEYQAKAGVRAGVLRRTVRIPTKSVEVAQRLHSSCTTALLRPKPSASATIPLEPVTYVFTHEEQQKHTTAVLPGKGSVHGSARRGAIEDCSGAAGGEEAVTQREGVTASNVMGKKPTGVDACGIGPVTAFSSSPARKARRTDRSPSAGLYEARSLPRLISHAGSLAAAAAPHLPSGLVNMTTT